MNEDQNFIDNIKQLEPCPFCGSPARYFEDDRDTKTQVLCTHTTCDLGGGWPMEKVVWQGRPIEDALRSELEKEKNGTKGLMLLADAQKLGTEIAMCAAMEQKNKLEQARAELTSSREAHARLFEGSVVRVVYDRVVAERDAANVQLDFASTQLDSFYAVQDVYSKRLDTGKGSMSDAEIVADAFKRLDSAHAELKAAGEDYQRCTWRQCEDGEWDSDCGVSWTFENGTPAENYMKFCSGCGHRLVELAYVDEEEEGEE